MTKQHSLEILHAEAAVGMAEMERGETYDRVLLAQGYSRIGGSSTSRKEAESKRPALRGSVIVYTPDLGGDTWSVYAK